KFICLTFEPENFARLNMSTTAKKLNAALGFQGLSIYLNSLQKIDTTKLVELINTMAHADALKRQNLILSAEL
ncbi:MAG TPA: hypothetical protein VFE54_00995, partial [Mucilaginibacter sp.]|nr:hypothetical protein [Mucilaginibacter sp.]